MATIVVTGASKGIGRATALLLDRRGHTVFAGVRTKKDGESLRADSSERLRPIMLDITKSDQVAAAAEAVEAAVGADGLDALVNNAGIAVPAPLEFLPIDELRRQLEVNLIGHLAVTQALLELLRAAKGRIVNIGSVGGRIAGRMLGAYHVSKFGIEALSDTLRQELAPWRIEVVCIEPGAIATPIWEGGMATADRLIEELPPRAMDYYGRVIDRTKAGAERAAKGGLAPERVAEVVERALMVRRPRARYVVGRDAKIVVGIISRLPDRLRDRLLSSAF